MKPAVPQAAPARPEPVSTVPTHSRAGTSAGYTVRAGDTMWDIAADLAGPNASAARIARELDRLWRLNRDRIASGSPGQISVGQRLRLR